jgi:catechol 2,3-dioxygenase
VRIGHAHLRTADIDPIRDFYVGILGFDVISEARDVPGWGTNGDILFLSGGGYHHHLGCNTWKSKGGPPQPDGVTGRVAGRDWRRWLIETLPRHEVVAAFTTW